MKNKNAIKTATLINSRVTATISISLVLFLLGLIILLSLFAKNLSIYVKENLSFSILLNENMSEIDIRNLQKMLSIAPYVKSSEYISRDQAAKELEKELGESSDVFLGFNPLLPSIEVKLSSEYANNDSIAIIEKNLRSLSHVENVIYRRDLTQSVNENIKKIGLTLFSLATILLLISFALINNTIRLMVYSKRFIIYTMKLVGATNAFIRKPFIRTNIFSGIIASLIAISMLTGLLYYLSIEVADSIELIDINFLLIVFIVIITLGIFISITATYFAVNKYLRMRGEDLYYI
jgi:cell division transport system permease protein